MKRPTEKHIYRASAGSEIIGHFTSATAAKKSLPASVIKITGGGDGFIDVYDPQNKVMRDKDTDSDGYKLMFHRVVGGWPGEGGWRLCD